MLRLRDELEGFGIDKRGKWIGYEVTDESPFECLQVYKKNLCVEGLFEFITTEFVYFLSWMNND
jgi:hypothetical protein